ncbi:TPA: T9SS type A sorting domain-containing protein [Candidatus Poribacteria bacterium]|nr:T9SS type A sorting domain-containing protein [Candidatus Poribacteria bacterium]
MNTSAFLKSSKITLTLLISLFLFSSLLSADDQIWTNGLSQPNDWGDGDNWQGNPADENVPKAGETATFNSGTVPSAGITLANVPDVVNIIAEASDSDVSITLPARTYGTITVKALNTGNITLTLLEGTISTQAVLIQSYGSGEAKLTINNTGSGSASTTSITMASIKIISHEGTAKMNVNNAQLAVSGDLTFQKNNTNNPVIDNATDVWIEGDLKEEGVTSTTFTIPSAAGYGLQIGGTVNQAIDLEHTIINGPLTFANTGIATLITGGELTIGGHLTLLPSASVSAVSTGRIIIGSGKIFDNSGTFQLSGQTDDRLLFASSTIGTPFELKNNFGAVLDFEWVAIRDCEYGSGLLGSVDFVPDDGVVNATGNSGWPAGKFATPVDQGASAFDAFVTTAILNDGQYYKLYTDTSGGAQTRAGLVASPHVYFNSSEGMTLGKNTAHWNSSDDPKLVDSPRNYYYAYMDPQNKDENEYIIISDNKLNVSLIAFQTTADFGEPADDLPTSGQDQAFTSIILKWTDRGEDAQIELRYSPVGTYVDFADVSNNSLTTLITDTLNAKDTNSYVWNTSALASTTGTDYYIYALYYVGGTAYTSVSKKIKLKSLEFTDPPITDIVVDTASVDSNIISSDHRTHIATWTDWDRKNNNEDLDIYVSQAPFALVDQLLSAVSETDNTKRAVLVQADLDPATANSVGWDLTAGFGLLGESPAPEGDYYLYAIADDGNGPAYDYLTISVGQVTVRHSPFFYDVPVTINPNKADSGNIDSSDVVTADTITVDWKAGDWDDNLTISFYYILKIAYDANPALYTLAKDIQNNTFEAFAMNSFGTITPISQFPETERLAKDPGDGFKRWDYYSATAVVPAGKYTVWVILEDTSGDLAAKKAEMIFDVTHSPAIVIDNPISSTDSTSTVHPYYTIAWSDVDRDEPALIDLFYSKTDLRGNVANGNGESVGGLLTNALNTAAGVTDQVTIASGYAKLTETPIDEDPEGTSDRFLFNFASGNASSPIDDNVPYYIYALIDSEGDGTYDAGYQSSGLVREQGSALRLLTPAIQEQTTLDYKVKWEESWTDFNVPVNIDLYFDKSKTKTIGELARALDVTDEKAPFGIIKKDIELSVDDNGRRIGSNEMIWDDLVILKTSPTNTATSNNTLVDTSLGSNHDYYIGRKLIFTSGIFDSAHTITDYDGNTGTLTFTPAVEAIVAPGNVKSYKIVIPDGTYYIYGVMDTAATDGLLNDEYNTGIEADPDCVLAGQVTGGTQTTVTDNSEDGLTTTEGNSLYRGARIVIVKGKAKGESRTITAYDVTTQTLTVDQAFSESVDSSSDYRIDLPEMVSISPAAVTISNHSLIIRSPIKTGDVGDYFVVDIKLDTNNQPIKAVDIYLNFDPNVIDVADTTQPFVQSTKGNTTTDGRKDGRTLISSSLPYLGIDNYYQGFFVVITSGNAKGQRRQVIDYDGVTVPGTITVDTAFTAQIEANTAFRLNQPFQNGVSIGPIQNSWQQASESNQWNAAILRNGSAIKGTADIVAASTSGHIFSIADQTLAIEDIFVTLVFQKRETGFANIVVSYDTARKTRTTDEDGNVHIPFNSQSIFTPVVLSPTASIFGTVRLQGWQTHAALLTFELRQPGSKGNFSAYVSADDASPIDYGIQIQTDDDGNFKLSNLPTGKFFLTAKTPYHMRGQNHHTIPLDIYPGVVKTGVTIHGYKDINGDGEFTGSGETEDFLFAGDITGDSIININDVTIFANNFGTNNNVADINQDKIVDTEDFKLIIRNFGHSSIGPFSTDLGVQNAAPEGRLFDSLLDLVDLPDELQLDEIIEIPIHSRTAIGLGFDIQFDPDKLEITLADIPSDEETFVVSQKIEAKDFQKILFAIANRQYLDQNITLRIKPLRIGNTSLKIENAKLVNQESITNFDTSTLNFLVIPKITKSALMQNYPNPFNPETWVPFAIKDAAPVQIHIYDAMGHPVRTLDLGFRKSGNYITPSKAAYWNGRNQLGEQVASGVYFYQIQADEFSSMKKMVILK